MFAKSMDNLLPMQEKEKKNKMFVSQGVPMLYGSGLPIEVKQNNADL